MICPYCETENPDESKFCKYCGRSFKKARTIDSMYDETTSETSDFINGNDGTYWDYGSDDADLSYVPEENNVFAQKPNNDSIFQKVFYVFDSRGKYRLSKTRFVSAIFFMLMFIFALSVSFPIDMIAVVACIIVAFFFTVPVYVIGWILSKII